MEAKAVLSECESTSTEPWVIARDSAVLILLYGCGLRISEALDIREKDIPLGNSMRVAGKGGKDVSHKRGGGYTLESPSKNRARNRGKK